MINYRNEPPDSLYVYVVVDFFVDSLSFIFIGFSAVYVSQFL